MSRIAGRDRTTPRTEASAMNWNVLASTAHKSPESPVPSSSAPGTAPTMTAGRPPRAASHSQNAPVSNGTKDEKDHHCEVMDSRTALSSRLFFSRCPSPMEQPSLMSVRHVRSILEQHAMGLNPLQPVSISAGQHFSKKKLKC